MSPLDLIAAFGGYLLALVLAVVAGLATVIGVYLVALAVKIVRRQFRDFGGR